MNEMPAQTQNLKMRTSLFLLGFGAKDFLSAEITTPYKVYSSYIQYICI